jgi:hypothetical protein
MTSRSFRQHGAEIRTVVDQQTCWGDLSSLPVRSLQVTGTGAQPMRFQF